MGADPTAVSAGEVLAALSLATDLGTDQPLEHGLRTCVLSARLAAAAGCDDDERADAYHLGLLHSVGCTSDAHEAAAAFGDDLRLRSHFGEIDPARPQELMGFLWRRTAESRAPHVASFAAAGAAARHPRQRHPAHRAAAAPRARRRRALAARWRGRRARGARGPRGLGVRP